MEILAIIPARGGSKGIKRKNLVDFMGKPLIAHSIGHALTCPCVTRTIVSTEIIMRSPATESAYVPLMSGPGRSCSRSSA